MEVDDQAEGMVGVEVQQGEMMPDAIEDAKVNFYECQIELGKIISYEFFVIFYFLP
jgi:hypothetical protein